MERGPRSGHGGSRRISLTRRRAITSVGLRDGSSGGWRQSWTESRRGHSLKVIRTVVWRVGAQRGGQRLQLQDGRRAADGVADGRRISSEGHRRARR